MAQREHAELRRLAAALAVQQLQQPRTAVFHRLPARPQPLLLGLERLGLRTQVLRLLCEELEHGLPVDAQFPDPLDDLVGVIDDLAGLRIDAEQIRQPRDLFVYLIQLHSLSPSASVLWYFSSRALLPASFSRSNALAFSAAFWSRGL